MSIPAYATLTSNNIKDYVWTISTADARGLQKVNSSTDRIAAFGYNETFHTQEINLTDGQTHQIAYYVLDWEPYGRTERIDVLDYVTNVVLDTRTVSDSSGGQYFVWNVKGHVIFRFTGTNYNSYFSGLFFDPM